MEFPQWEPYYHRIVSDLRLSTRDDEASARCLHRMCKGRTICGPDCLQRLIGENVTVLGDGPSLETGLHRHALAGTVLAADGATSKLMHEVGMVPDLIVTDLDGEVEDQICANAQGSVAVILAHGDNRDRIERFVPWFSGKITPTTQARPFEGIFNFGGFTDGDRAVMLARHFGATRIDLLGFDMEDPRPKPGRSVDVKRMKLRIARELIWDLNPPEVELRVLR